MLIKFRATITVAFLLPPKERVIGKLFCRFHRNDEYLHEVFQNRTLSLIFKDIRSKFIDIGPPLGLSNIVYAAFECVLHYGMDFDLYWILPQRRPISLFIKLMAEDYIGLILTSVLAMFAALTATWWAVVHFDTRGNFSHALISVISLCLACPLPFSPASRKMRMLLMFCFGAFIPLNVVVQSFVTSTLTEPYLEPKLENIYDLARSDLAMKYQYGLGINIIGGVDNTTRNMILRKSIPLVIYDIEEMRGINRTAILAFTQILWYLRNHEEAEKYKEVRYC